MATPPEPDSRPILSFAVIADSHFHLDGHDPQSAYPSDATHNERNRSVVACLNRAAR